MLEGWLWWRDGRGKSEGRVRDAGGMDLVEGRVRDIGGMVMMEGW